MNAKLKFIEDSKIDISEIRELLKNDLKNYGELIDTYEKYLNLKSEFSAKWNSLLNNPHYEFVEEDDQFKIKSSNTTIAIAPNKDYADVLNDLLNMSFREGAKEIIEMIMSRF